MQIQPDYSHQLEEIAKALTRSSIPQWMVALIAALFGAFLGVAGQWLMKVIENRREILKMRRVRYLDLLTMFQRVEDIMRHSVPVPSVWSELLQSTLNFEGEAYSKAHQDVYMQLPERLVAEVLYAAYHKTLDHESVAREHWDLTKRLLADAVETNQLRRRYIEKFLGPEVKELLEKLHAICEDSERLYKPLSGTTEPMDEK